MTDETESGPVSADENGSTGDGNSPPREKGEPTAGAGTMAGEDGGTDGNPKSPPYRRRKPVLTAVAARLRSDPWLFVPFFVAGCVLLVADLLRETDAVPTASSVGDSTFHVAYSIYPTGTTVTERSLNALVDLELPLLGYALALEVLAVTVIAVAGWMTMMRASDETVHWNRFLVYFGGVFLVTVLFETGDAVGLEYTTGSLLVGVALLGLVLFVLVRLFLAPVAVLYEDGILRPIAAGWRYSRGHGFTLFGVLLVVGLGSWWLAHVPSAGTLLSTTIAGTVHAVSLVVLYDRCRDESTVENE
ncbi:hypothetical protein [Natronobacterium texcoconense]|uniref:Uncharacterized protein n=1 Tax=Natronobacterium texcoconense TaxID=1095778 RepID=A0A1H1FVP0_NATTX|nr:hypothetical protein [Natronobacterium texcoconense]SDR05033.1 hypothetical protein SAMN04489842_2137 [Natronobacterium texcoconense]